MSLVSLFSKYLSFHRRSQANPGLGQGLLRFTRNDISIFPSRIALQLPLPLVEDPALVVRIRGILMLSSPLDGEGKRRGCKMHLSRPPPCPLQPPQAESATKRGWKARASSSQGRCPVTFFSLIHRSTFLSPTARTSDYGFTTFILTVASFEVAPSLSSTV